MSDYLLSDLLIGWYASHQRVLPWRETTNPYLIWVSEIILQQTRVQQGLDYYHRFVGRFPNVATLAAAPLQEVLLYWQGLGYYSRARNLHAASRQVMEVFQGEFPSTYADILSLKGVGSYTAAAIASFSYNLPYAVLDGNVFRVLARVLGIDTPIDTTSGKKQFQEAANLLCNPSKVALHNQSIMEFGALQCIPGQPDCSICPLKEYCLAFAQHRVTALPMKQGKTKVRERWFYYFLVDIQGDTYLHQRLKKDIWSHLYEFPLLETERRFSFEELQQLPSFQHLFAGQQSLVFEPVLLHKKHVLSHQHIYADFYRVRLSTPLSSDTNLIRIPWEMLDQYPVSQLTRLCVEQLA